MEYEHNMGAKDPWKSQEFHDVYFGSKASNIKRQHHIYPGYLQIYVSAIGVLYSGPELIMRPGT
jgi:hypothetical protein